MMPKITILAILLLWLQIFPYSDLTSLIWQRAWASGLCLNIYVADHGLLILL
jgi:hypothetical protein